MTTVLEGLDWVVLAIYFLALILVAVWVVLQKNKNTEDYFLAGRNVGWFVIGASIFASNIAKISAIKPNVKKILTSIKN